MAKYLSRNGWDVTVVSPDPSLWREVNQPHEVAANLAGEGIQRIMTDHQWRCLRPAFLKSSDGGAGHLLGGVSRIVARRFGVDADIGWMKPAERSCQSLQPGDIDLVLATGSPFGTFGVARRIADRLGCPYVLDYRDPWTANPHVSRPVRPKEVHEEMSLLEGCAAATIVSDAWAANMEHRFGVGGKLHAVSNGYDPDDLASVARHDFGHFAIVYTGGFYPPKRVITPIMAALPSLDKTLRREWKFHYYGLDENHVRQEAERFDVADRVIVHGQVTRAEALSAVAGAGVSVVITTVEPQGTEADKGIVTGKIFESMGLGSPVLLLAPEGSDATRVVEATSSGKRVAGSDIEGIVRTFGELSSASRWPRGRDTEYSWPVLGRKMHNILSDVVSRKASVANSNTEPVS